MPAAKISIKLKSANSAPTTTNEPTKPKVSLKLKSKDSLSVLAPKKIEPVVVAKSTVKVSYVFLDEGEFLYDASTCKLYTPKAPYRCVGELCKDTMSVNLGPQMLVV